MAIQINGNGTITGVSVGGLPDGIVDTDMLAASAVDNTKLAAGSVIKVTYGTHSTTGLSTTSTSWQNYTNSNITVTKLRSGNGSGGSVLLILGNAWLNYEGTSANGRHFAYTIMRDGTELTGDHYGLGNLYAGNANGYQSSADINYMDTASLSAGNYDYSLGIKSPDGTVTCMIGNAQRTGSWQILEVAT